MSETNQPVGTPEDEARGVEGQRSDGAGEEFIGEEVAVTGGDAFEGEHSERIAEERPADRDDGIE